MRKGRMKRSEFLWGLGAMAVLGRGAGGAEVEGIEGVRREWEKLDEVFWIEAIANWSDRPGRDLRGHFEGRMNPPWWSAANAVEAWVDSMERGVIRSGEARLRQIHRINRVRGTEWEEVTKVLKRDGRWREGDERHLRMLLERKKNLGVSGVEFRNEYFDDSAWWGIAWLRAYQVVKEPAYLRTAQVVQRYLAEHWREDGGVPWATEEGKRGPNAITNSLFVVLSARLAKQTSQKALLDWARKGMGWMKEVKLYDGVGVVDRPRHRGDYWTYNQGAYVGALTALWEATREKAYLEEAAKVADTVILQSGLVKDGLWYEKLSTNGWDVGMFKGIGLRYFGQLVRLLEKQRVMPEVAGRIRELLKATAEAVRKVERVDGLIPMEWQPEPRAVFSNYNTQLSGILALLEV